MRSCYRLYVGSLLLIQGCSHPVESIVVPINRAAVDFNQSTQHLSLPFTDTPDTALKLKGSKLVFEKTF